MRSNDIFKQARWIGAGSESPYSLCVRDGFTMDQAVSASMTVCGLGHFKAYIDGQEIAPDWFVPALSDYAPIDIRLNGGPFDEVLRHRCYCMRYDITPFAAGKPEHELAFILSRGFYSEPIHYFDGFQSYGEMRLIYRIEWTDSRGASHSYVSGPQARLNSSFITDANFYRHEKQDLNRLSADWKTAEYSGWDNAVVLEDLDTDFYLQDCPADRIIRYITPRLVRSFSGCDVYDLGENITGWVILRDESEQGETVEVQFSEALDHCGSLNELYKQHQSFQYISDGQGRVIHPVTTWFGFSCFSVTGKAKPISCTVIHADIPKASSFKSSSPLLNWLYTAFERTQLDNLHMGVPSDCPHLERKGYTGDGQLTCETQLTVLNHQSLIRKWIRDIADCQDSVTGHVQYTAPYTHNGGGPGGWGSAIVIVPWQYYKYYGDTDCLREMYAGMLEHIRYLHDHSENGLVTSGRPGDWCLGDWCTPSTMKLPEAFVNTYYLIKCIDITGEIAKIIDLPADSQHPQWRQDAVDGMISSYFDENSGDFCRGVQGANAFAVDIGLGNEKTLLNLCEHYRKTRCYDTGIIGTEIVTRVLFEKGFYDIAYDLLTSEEPTSFASWMNAGATTLWEYWPSSPRDRSLNHSMFGACVKELFKYILGIRQREDNCGWRDIVIEPVCIQKLTQACGHITVPNGEIHVSYTYSPTENSLILNASVPEGTDAVCRLCGREYPLHSGSNTIKTAF